MAGRKTLERQACEYSTPVTLHRRIIGVDVNVDNIPEVIEIGLTSQLAVNVVYIYIEGTIGDTFTLYTATSTTGTNWFSFYNMTLTDGHQCFAIPNAPCHRYKVMGTGVAANANIYYEHTA